MSVSKKLWALLAIIASTLAALVVNHNEPGSPPSNPRTKTATLVEENRELSAHIASLTQERKELETRVEALQEKVNRFIPSKPEPSSDDAPAHPLKTPSASRQAAEPQSTKEAETPFSKAVLALATRAGELNRHFMGMPEKEIPELQYLDEGDWLHLAKAASLDSPEGVRKALADVRQQAKVRFAPMLTTALASFYKANNAQPPISMEQLKPYFTVPVDDATLARYQIFTDPTGKQKLGSSTTIQETAAVDPEYDSHFEIGLTGWSATTLRDSYSEKFRGN